MKGVSDFGHKKSEAVCGFAFLQKQLNPIKALMLTETPLPHLFPQLLCQPIC